MATTQRVQQLIKDNYLDMNQRLEWYDRYRTDKLPITEKVAPSYLADDKTAPVNRLVLTYETEIVNNRVNYLMANPYMIQYSDPEESETVQEQRAKQIADFIKDTDFHHLLMDTAISAGAGGASAIVAYQMEGNKIGLLSCAPWEYSIVQNADQTETIEAVRYWVSKGADDKGNTTYTVHAEYYDTNTVTVFQGQTNTNTAPDLVNCPPLVQVEEYPHFFGQVPLFELANNSELQPSFYKVISLIDAQNRLHSDFVNEMESFRHAYMMLTNYCGDAETAKSLRDARVIAVDDNGDAKFITKDINPEAFKQITEQLDRAIERFSGNLDYSDPEVYGRATNLAISTRVKPLENAAKSLSLQIDCMLNKLLRLFPISGMWCLL